MTEGFQIQKINVEENAAYIAQVETEARWAAERGDTRSFAATAATSTDEARVEEVETLEQAHARMCRECPRVGKLVLQTMTDYVVAAAATPPSRNDVIGVNGTVPTFTVPQWVLARAEMKGCPNKMQFAAFGKAQDWAAIVLDEAYVSFRAAYYGANGIVRECCARARQIFFCSRAGLHPFIVFRDLIDTKIGTTHWMRAREIREVGMTPEQIADMFQAPSNILRVQCLEFEAEHYAKNMNIAILNKKRDKAGTISIDVDAAVADKVLATNLVFPLDAIIKPQAAFAPHLATIKFNWRPFGAAGLTASYDVNAKYAKLSDVHAVAMHLQAEGVATTIRHNTLRVLTPVPISTEFVESIKKLPTVSAVVTDVPPSQLRSDAQRDNVEEAAVQDGDDEANVPRPANQVVVFRSTTMMTARAWRHILPEDIIDIIEIKGMWVKGKFKGDRRVSEADACILQGKGIVFDV